MAKNDEFNQQHPERDYHFSFSNDNRTLKFSVSNDGFRALKIQADSIRETNFGGGLRNINELFLVNCLELSTIKWPSGLTHITRLGIGSANNLKKLDLLSLPELQELTLVDCPELTDIIGISTNIKKITIKNCPLKTIKLVTPSMLEVMHLSTSADSFSINLHGYQHLSLFNLNMTNASPNLRSIAKLDLSSCANLGTLRIHSSPAPIDLNTTGCEKLTHVYIDAGDKSQTIGLPASTNCDFCYVRFENTSPIMSAPKHFSSELSKLNKTISALENDLFSFTENDEDIETVLQQRGAKRADSRRDMALIHLMGVPEQSFKPEGGVRHVKLPQEPTAASTAKTTVDSELASLVQEIEEEREEFVELLKEKKNPVIAIKGIKDPADSVLIPVNAIICNQHPESIKKWLENDADKDINTLILTPEDLKISAIQQFFEKITVNPELVVFDGQSYLITDSHKILVLGDEFVTPELLPQISLSPFSYQQLFSYIQQSSGLDDPARVELLTERYLERNDLTGNDTSIYELYDLPDRNVSGQELQPHGDIERDSGSYPLPEHGNIERDSSSYPLPEHGTVDTHLNKLSKQGIDDTNSDELPEHGTVNAHSEELSKRGILSAHSGKPHKSNDLSDSNLNKENELFPHGNLAASKKAQFFSAGNHQNERGHSDHYIDHKAHAASPNTSKANTDLLTAAKSLALQIGQLLATAEASKTGNNELLNASKDVAVAIQHLQAVARLSTTDITRKQVHHKLLMIRNNYIKLATQKSMFGSAFQVGLHKQRLEIILTLLDALHNHRQLKISDLEASIKELSKDKNIQVHLQPIEEALKYYLCKQPNMNEYKTRNV